MAKRSRVCPPSCPGGTGSYPQAPGPGKGRGTSSKAFSLLSLEAVGIRCPRGFTCTSSCLVHITETWPEGTRQLRPVPRGRRRRHRTPGPQDFVKRMRQASRTPHPTQPPGRQSPWTRRKHPSQTPPPLPPGSGGQAAVLSLPQAPLPADAPARSPVTRALPQPAPQASRLPTSRTSAGPDTPLLPQETALGGSLMKSHHREAVGSSHGYLYTRDLGSLAGHVLLCL